MDEARALQATDALSNLKEYTGRLNARQWQVVSLLVLHGYFDGPSLAASEVELLTAKTRITKRQVRDVLRDLVQLGVVRQSKLGQEMHYSANSRWRPTEEEAPK
jgi:hypothetical protein